MRDAGHYTRFMLRVGVDTGGTFTDFVWVENGCRRTLKVPSTPDDPARAVREGLARLAGLEPARGAAAGPRSVCLPAGSAVVHGSTVATNALLEGKVAQVALITNKGFEDILAIGRQNRPDLYNAAVLPPEPLVPARLRLGIPGRLGPEGEEWEALDAAAVTEVVRQATASGITRFAVCLLHAYANPAHEEEVGRLIEKEGAEATLSCRILPEYREYERMSTTVVNAALAPVMSGYLERLEDSLPETRLSVFRSNGGILSARAAGREAVQTLLSGPAAGVLGAWAWGRHCGLTSLITFDMGGTSTDVSLIDGQPATTTECSVAGYPVRLPMIDIHTVGAGGGSLARRDAGGALLVGPQSAGADPGPACYGRGEEATVTDAQLFLGRLPAQHFLGGQMRLEPRRAAAALARLARSLELDPRAAAAGVVDIANAGMARAIRVVSLARGHDPRDFSLFCFGGAGGLHAVDLAVALGMPEVVVPPDSGTFSAYGMMTADVVMDASRAVLRPLAAVGRKLRDEMALPLEERLMADMEQEGFQAADVGLVRTLDLRYLGQSFELTVPEGGDPAAAFHALHLRRYDYQRPGEPVDLVALRVRAVGPVGMPMEVAAPTATAASAVAATPPQARESREAWFAGRGHATGLFLRDDLLPGQTLPGPAIVADSGSTTVVPPGWRLKVDPWRNLRLTPDPAVSPAP